MAVGPTSLSLVENLINIEDNKGGCNLRGSERTTEAAGCLAASGEGEREG
jgi:hypothetical protein